MKTTSHTKKTKTLTLTEEDNTAARATFFATGLMSQSCLLFQAAQREGLDPKEVSFGSITCQDGSVWWLDDAGIYVAHRGVHEWHYMIGRTVTLSQPEDLQPSETL